MTSLHVVSGFSAAESIASAMAVVDPTSKVVGFPDRLSAGPLSDVDGSGALQEAFWERAGGGAEWREWRAAEQAGWEEVRTSREIVVWHGPSPTEYLFALRLAARVRASGQSLSEVVLHGSSRCMPAFFHAVSARQPHDLEPMLTTKRRVVDLERRAETWAEACADGACFRELADDGSLTALSEDAYDALLLGHCSSEWTRTPTVMGMAMAEVPIGDRHAAWRIAELISSGVLQGRGDGRYGAAEVRRSAPGGR
jgi:hypothetical protein